jgi:membrane associated rhomboid family serine protease
MGDSTAILVSHQWYRLVTALTLHADVVHLMGNCFLGGFLLHFLLLTTGNGIGLFTVLLSSTAANCINVFMHGPDHRFVGFSTAVFVVIGMLCVIGFAGKSKQSPLSLLMPVMAGLALLALLGSSGERTDLGGHLFGLLCGLFAGNIVKYPHFKKWRNSISLQVILSLMSYFIIWFCWHSALSSL